MRRGFVWLLAGTAAALAVLAAVGGAAGEWVPGVWGAACAGAAGFVVPAVWDRVKERRDRVRTELERRSAAVARLAEVSDEMTAPPAMPTVPRPRGTGDVVGLLRPQRAVVAFIGREGELRRLREWCHADGRNGGDGVSVGGGGGGGTGAAVALVTGTGGVGKTRLALRLAEELRQRGWSCRWVRAGGEADVVTTVREVGAAPVLLVVDYAETRTGLRALLTAVAGSRSGQGGPERDSRRLRVLLLARSEGEWWERLQGVPGPVGAAVAGAVTVALEPGVLPRWPERQLVAEAVPQFARALGIPPPRHAEVTLADEGVPLLVLHAAALVLVLRAREAGAPGAPAALPGAALPVAALPVAVGSAVLDELLRHEKRYWYESAAIAALTGPGGLDTTAVQRCVAVTSLLDADSEAAAADLLSLVPGLDAPWCDPLRRRTARWLSTLYPGTSPGAVGPLQPDLLAEHHIARQLDRSPEMARLIGLRLDASHARRALTVLTRAHAHQPGVEAVLEGWLAARLPELAEAAVTVAVETPGPLGPLMARVLAEADLPLTALQHVKRAIPYPTLALAEADMVVTHHIVEALPEEATPERRAMWLEALGLAFHQVGRRMEALAPMEEAERIRRRLVRLSPEQHRPGLAACLSSLGHRLAEAGRVPEALTAAQEAVGLYRDLAHTFPSSPDRYRPALAECLNSLGMRLSEAGRVDEALAATQEAVDLELVGYAPDRRPHVLAMLLHNLGNRLFEAGREDEALAPTREAADLYRELVRHAPDRHRPGLASCLNNLGNRLSDAGLRAEALTAAQEAVDLYRDLARTSPDRYRPGLAACLNNLGNRLSDAGREQDALVSIEEAVRVHRALHRELRQGPRRDPVRFPYRAQARTNTDRADVDRFRHALAASLRNLGIQLTAVGRDVEARAAHAEAASLTGDGPP
ncbi:tetratricopeptide repeat protein [Streptomyces daliensis]